MKLVALGSTRLLTNSSQNITDKYAYDAYGALISHDIYSDSVDQPYQYVGQLGYYTHWMEPDFGLLQLGVRFYDTEVGRFTSRDDVWSKRSLYLYGSGRPTLRIDPSGAYATDPYDTSNCAANCPNLDSALKEIVSAMENNDACKQAIEDVGCTWWINKKMKPPKGTNMLSGITFGCYPHNEKCKFTAQTSNTMISLNGCNGDDKWLASTLIHELTHACAYAGNGGKGPKENPGYKCDQGEAEWGPGEGNPVWEGNAEKVKHACFPFTRRPSPGPPAR